MSVLRERIKKLGPGAPTALAELAGVPAYDVSKLQRNSKLVSRDHATRIESALADLEALVEARDTAGPFIQSQFMIDFRDTERLKRSILTLRESQAENAAAENSRRLSSL